MPDPNLRLVEEAATKLARFLREIVFVDGVTMGLLITDKAAAPIRSTNDVDVIAEILTSDEWRRNARQDKDAGVGPPEELTNLNGILAFIHPDIR